MDQNQNFINLAKKYEQLQKDLEAVRTELNKSMTELKIGTYTQDPETNAVYKIVKPKGTFMYYKDIDFVRTALQGEGSGSLSKKEATENGFTL